MDTSKLSFASLKDKVSSKLKKSAEPRQKAKKAAGPKAVDSKKSTRNEKPSRTQQAPNPASPAKTEDDEILRREAFALGATEEDLKLLEGVNEGEQSEEEFEMTESKLDNSFGNDLSKFMKTIGLGNGTAVIVEEDEVPELVADEETDIEEEEEEEEEQEQEQEEEQEDQEDDEIQEKVLDFNTKKQLKAKKEETTSSVVSDRLLVEPRTDWYNVKYEQPAPESLSPQQVARLFELGKDALEEDNKIYYEEFSKSSSQRKFLSEILTSGTLNDKISALTLLIQEAPMHNLKALDNLLGMCSKKSRTAALQSINALKDLFINNGILPDRKLITFTKQIALSNALSKKALALLYFEDYLKKLYFKFVGILEVLSHDPIVHVRSNIVNHLFDLLKSKPEQEANLLRLGVNKLGDIENKVSSKTSYQILQLEQQHPLMKKIVIDAVTDVIFKQNTDYHAIYYGVLALNQTILTRREDDIANSLIKTYFTLFEKILIESDEKNTTTLKTSDYNKTRAKRSFKKGKKGGKSVKVDEKSENEVVEEKNSKLFSSILTGLNRAFPFCTLSTEIFNQHLDTLFKITHSANFNTSVQALVLIHQVVTSSEQLNKDRFFRTLYESLWDQRLLTSSKQGIYLNLLFKALKADQDINRVAAFVKRICQVCLSWLNIGTISGMIFLLINLEKSIPTLRNLVLNAPVDDEAETETAEAKTVENAETKTGGEYDPKARDPRFANANKSSLWELNHFLSHYHPTVSLYAESFLEQNQDIKKPDLGLYTLAHFLDRFVYKSAKQKGPAKGSSIMQPLPGAQTGALLVRTAGADDVIPVNTKDWLNSKAEQIRPDEMFFYNYFSSKQSKISRSKFDKDLAKKAEDDEEGSDLDDEEVWSALVKSNPEVEGDEGSDLEDYNDFSDFNASDFSDDEDEDKLVFDDNDSDSDDGEEELFMGDVATSNIAEDEDEDEEEVEDAEIDSDISDLVEAEIFKGDSEDEFASEEVDFDGFEETSSDDKAASKKRKADVADKRTSKSSKKSKLKELPLFADADEYAKYLESDNESS